MDSQLQGEIDRLEDLQQMNANVRTEEIDALRSHKEELRAAIASARLRVDALRLIFRMS
jgi:ATP-dependent helicase HepA